MKHSQETIDIIFHLKQAGLSSRQIARELEISKSSVNNVLNRNAVVNTPQSSHRKLRIAIVDVETSAAKVYCFGRFDQNISQNAVADEGGKILVACWKWLGEDEVTKLYMTPDELRNGDDSAIIDQLYYLYNQADAAVMHNGKRFDQKMIQTRGIYHGNGRLPTIKIIDTLEMAKRVLRLPSNKLDSIGAYFGLGRKEDTGGIELWKDVQEGDIEAMTKMVNYCVQDVNLLEKVYLELVSLGAVGFNAGLYFNDNHLRCRACGSNHLTDTGRFTYTATGKFKELHCEDCGHNQRDTTNLNSKEKRKSLLSAI